MIRHLVFCVIQALTTAKITINPSSKYTGPNACTLFVFAGFVIATGYAIAVTIESNRNKKMLQQAIDLCKAKAIKAYNELCQMEMPVTAETVKLKMRGEEQEIKTLHEAFTYHNERIKAQIGTEVTYATYSKYETLKKKITAFIKQRFKRNDIYLKELNHSFAVDFELYLKTVEKITHNPTIKHIQFLKKIIHLSVASSWIDRNPFVNFKCSLKEVDRGHLTAEELNAIETTQISLPRLSKLRETKTHENYSITEITPVITPRKSGKPAIQQRERCYDRFCIK